MPNRAPKVVVIGGTYADIAVRCARIPVPGHQVAGTAVYYTATGPGPNQAVEAALCGCEACLVSKVGGDPVAQMIREVLAEFKVDTHSVYVAQAKKTGAVITLIDAKGENATIVYHGANNALLEQDIKANEGLIQEAGVCLIDGCLPEEAIVCAIRCAKLHGTRVILNPARPMGSQGLEAGKEAELPAEYYSADVLIPNLSEAADISDQTDVSIRTAKLIGSELVARGSASVVITMGRRGCMIVDRQGADHVPAFEVELVDQAGRGDAFAGALAAYLAVENDLAGAVKFASAAGALTCTKFGSIEALPSRAEIIELLQKEDSY